MNMQKSQMSPRQVAQSRYKSARWDLLIVIIFTVLNIVMLLTGSETMMLFSATIPYYAVVLAYVANMEFGGLEWFVTGSLILAFIILAVYLLCWIFSKKRHGWLIAALVLFCVDTAATLVLYMDNLASGIMDFVIHGAVIYYLALGVKAGKDLKYMPEEVVPMPNSEVTAQVPLENSTAIRWADPELKHRVLLEAEEAGCRICRRVGRTNELVINGYVYAEVEMLIEPSHELTAVFNGHKIVAGFNSLTSKSYILLDDRQIAEKVRLV